MLATCWHKVLALALFLNFFQFCAKMLIEISAYLRYFKVLIQEMDLKLDLGFLYAILDLFTPENASIMTSEQEVRYSQIQAHLHLHINIMFVDMKIHQEPF